METPEQTLARAGGKVVVMRGVPASVTACEAQDGDRPPQELAFVRPHTLQGKPVPPREWIVQDWLPVGCATLNYGDGGTGKTLLSQQLMTSTACGKPWIGLAVQQCRSAAIFCEDDLAELQRRQERINAAYGIDFLELEAMAWASGVGQDNTLMRFKPDGSPIKLPRIAEIRTFARDHRAQLIVVDTAADTFGGNENERAQVRNFMGEMNALAMELTAAVLINAHPSRTGMAGGGDMDGGSTAWSNTARSRWSLARPKPDGDSAADTDERILTRRKANYAAVGECIKLRWCNGVLSPASRLSGLSAAAAEADADAVFLALLARTDESNHPVSASPCAHNFAPKVFFARPDRKGFNRRELEAAMHRLMAAGKVTLINYGRKGDERRRLALADCGAHA